MKMKALKSFASREVSAIPGQVFTCSEELAVGLIQAKYAEPVEKAEPVSEPEQPKGTKKEAADESKRVDNNGNKPAAKGKRGRSK